MRDFRGEFAGFKLSEDLKNKFIDFETVWGTKGSIVKPYKVITIINNDITESELEIKERNNAELA